MKIHPLEFSIVVVGQDCNPTILNPDFLRYRKIVPEEWDWKVEGPAITTPAFATVPYDNGVTITVEPTRVSFIDRKCGSDVAASKATNVARAYIDVLPHVRYTGAGINLRTLIQMDDPEAYLKKCFIKHGPWEKLEQPLESAAITLTYPHDGARFNLSLEGATVTIAKADRTERWRGVLAAANFHRDCEEYPTDRQVIEHVDHAPSDASYFEEVLKKLFGDIKSTS